MKVLRHLLLLLVAIISQGVLAQGEPNIPTGSGTSDDPYVIGVGEWTFTLPYTSGVWNYYSCMNIKNFTVFKFVAPKDGKIEIISSANKNIQYAFYNSNKSLLYNSTSMSLFECGDEWFESGETYYIGLHCTGGQVNGGLLTVNYYCKNHENTEVIPGTATCTQGGTIEYMLCHDCGGRFTNDEEQLRLNDWDINVDPLGHDLDGCICTRCNQEVGLTVGEKVINLPAGDYQETVYQFTAATTGTIDVSAVTNAYIEDLRVILWSEYVRGPASAPRKAARMAESPEPYTVSHNVRAGDNYAVVLTTSADEETTATVNVSYSDIYIEGDNIDLATVLADNPDVASFSFESWKRITACTITRDVKLDLGNLNVYGQLKIDNGANVVLANSGNVSFEDNNENAFAIEVIDGDLTYRGSNLNTGYLGGAVLVKKGSFTFDGGRIYGNEGIVARKSLGSTDDVTINIANGAEIETGKVAVYMDVNGHLTIDNPGWYQGIRSEIASVVAKAGTIDLINIPENALRTTGPVGWGEERQVPVMHGSIPYLDGVPSVALQVGTDEEGFTGTTVLRMRNVTLVQNLGDGDGETVEYADYQKVLITGSEAHPTKYQLTNVRGKGQIVVENAEFVEEVGVQAVHDGENTNVSLPAGTSLMTALKYTATEDKLLEVTATTNATIEYCSIIPWSEWDGEEEEGNNGDVQYAPRKANAPGGEPTDNILASMRVIAGNSYAIIFTTTAATEEPVTVTLHYSDINIPSAANDFMLEEGKNELAFDSYLYNYTPQETGYVTISCEEASYMSVAYDESTFAWVDNGETTISFSVVGGNNYSLYIDSKDDVNTAILHLSFETHDAVSELHIGDNWVEVAGGDNEEWNREDSNAYTLIPFTPEKDGIVTIQSKGNEDTVGALFDEDGNYLISNDDSNGSSNFMFYYMVEANKTYNVGVRSYPGYAMPLCLINVSFEDILEFDGTLELATVDGDNVTDNDFYQTVMNFFPTQDDFSMVFVAKGGVNYKRNATSSKWGTVVLPYELQSNEKVAYYELTAADIPTGNLEFTKVKTVAPNTPTVYRILDGGQYDASVDGPVIVELPEYLGDFDLFTDTKVEDWYMDGWYYQTVIDTQNDGYFMDGDGNYNDCGIMYISGDKFWHATGTVTVKPYRAIFEAYGVDWNSAPAKALTISFKDDGGTVTTIESVMEENGEFNDVEAVYNIDGQKMNGIQRGVNIIRTADGKTRKFIKK